MTHAPWTPEAQGATGTLAALREVWGPHSLLSCPPPHRRGRRANSSVRSPRSIPRGNRIPPASRKSSREVTKFLEERTSEESPSGPSIAGKTGRASSYVPHPQEESRKIEESLGGPYTPRDGPSRDCRKRGTPLQPPPAPGPPSGALAHVFSSATSSVLHLRPR